MPELRGCASLSFWLCVPRPQPRLHSLQISVNVCSGFLLTPQQMSVGSCGMSPHVDPWKYPHRTVHAASSNHSLGMSAHEPILFLYSRNMAFSFLQSVLEGLEEPSWTHPSAHCPGAPWTMAVHMGFCPEETVVWSLSDSPLSHILSPVCPAWPSGACSMLHLS